jgi:hypothetical protein
MDAPSAPQRSARVLSAGDVAAFVDAWWSDHFPGSPVAPDTTAWNHAFAAKEDLKRRFSEEI